MGMNNLHRFFTWSQNYPNGTVSQLVSQEGNATLQMEFQITEQMNYPAASKR